MGIAKPMVQWLWSTFISGGAAGFSWAYSTGIVNRPVRDTAVKVNAVTMATNLSFIVVGCLR